MHASTAYERREALSNSDLERLRQALVDEIARYQVGIRGYSPEKMERFGKPFLAKLHARLANVQDLQRARAASSGS